MLEGIKRWLTGGSGDPAGPWQGVGAWAESNRYAYKVVPDQGFVVDGRLGTTPWRLEWGPSQRPYIGGRELRLRSELGLHPELQAVVMNRQLQQSMEKAVYEQFVEGVQTRIDNQTPPEMRWLVLYAKLGSAEMGVLRDRYVALGSQTSWIAHWLGGPLAASLQALRVEPGVPVVLMIGRGRLMLRTALESAEVPELQMWLRLFEGAMREARRVADEHAASMAPSTQTSLWSPSALPGDEHQKR